MMLTESAIYEAAQRMAAAAHAPLKVIVFGSYGRGDADEGSDLDLLVVEREIPDYAQEYLRGLRDRLTLRLLQESGEAPEEVMGFHAQQACEKFLKAVLVMHGIEKLLLWYDQALTRLESQT